MTERWEGPHKALNKMEKELCWNNISNAKDKMDPYQIGTLYILVCSELLQSPLAKESTNPEPTNTWEERVCNHLWEHLHRWFLLTNLILWKSNKVTRVSRILKLPKYHYKGKSVFNRFAD